MRFEKIKAASNGRAAVAVTELCGCLALAKYAPSGIGHPERRAEFNTLFARAAAKLGWKRDRRCREGWRKVAAEAVA